MIGRLNHVAIAVKDLAAATAVYRDALGATVTPPLPQPEPSSSRLLVSCYGIERVHFDPFQT